MKLFVGVAVLDAVDQGRQRLNDTVTIRTEDLSLYVQPLAKFVGPSGYQTTIGDLVRRAIIDSDSAATDFLISRLGGPSAVQAVLKAKRISGIRVDRDERHLQTEIVGLTWRPEYVDAAKLDDAINKVPKERRTRRRANRSQNRAQQLVGRLDRCYDETRHVPVVTLSVSQFPPPILSSVPCGSSFRYGKGGSHER